MLTDSYMKTYNYEHSEDTWGALLQRCDFTVEKMQKKLTPSFYILGKPLFFSVFRVKKREQGGVGDGGGSLKQNTPVFSGDMCEKAEWLKGMLKFLCCCCFIRMWKLYALPVLWTWEVGLVPVRAGLCGSFWKEEGIKFGFNLEFFRSTISLTKSNTDFQKFSLSTA